MNTTDLLQNNTSRNSTAETNLKDFFWNLFLDVANIFVVYVTAVWLIFGFMGNLTSIYIFFSKRKIDRVSSGYLGPLAIFDFINVCVGVFMWVVLGDNGLGMEGYSETTYGCWAAWFSIQFFMAMSGWTIVMFSCERCLVVWFPLKMTPLMTPKVRLKLIVGLVCTVPLYTVVAVTEKGFFHDDPTWVPACVPRGNEILVFMFWFVCVGLAATLPCICVLLLNLLILIGIRRAASQIEGKHSKNQTEKEMRCLKNLLFVSLFYLIFMLPYSILWPWSASAKEDPTYIDELAFYSLNWASQNYCINPILYCYSLPWYRQTLIRMYTCGLVNYDPDKSAKSKSKTSSTTG